ncbi:site-specific integrase [Methylobacterium sp. 37f]|uniref:site-specific integrase n=1 Tax=Methylobacterium sp. 37f TaxID=2817058 RepID=UPI001FFD7630|nr:site-specific integrase [Methylobacterium sp. 37f]MCK2053799.1 site-specific integrase [Methylobacterium sp. 37f]
MARYPNLTQRGHRYYLRVRVPADLRPFDKRTHVAVSLRTSDYREAVRRYREEQARVAREFDALRTELAERSATTLALNEGRLEDLSNEQLETLVQKWFEGRERFRRPSIRFGEEANVLELLKQDAAQLDEPDAARSSADALLIAAGMPSRRRRIGRDFLTVDRTGRQYHYLIELVAHALRAENKLAHNFALGRPVATDTLLFAHESTVQPAVSPAHLSVKELISRYRADREIAHGRESTDRKYSHVFRALEEALGPSRLVQNIRREDCRAVRDFLARVPSNASKRFPRLSLAKAIEAAEINGVARLSPTTVASYMNNLSALLNWAVQEELIERNPAKGLVEKGRAQVKRRGFTPAELKVLFKALAPMRFTHPQRFWVPALALFTGARAGELCQLRVADVIKVQSIWCLDLSEFDAEGRRVDDKSLKTAASERVLPIHHELLEAGFIDYVEHQTREGCEMIFPQLASGSKGSYSHEFSKFFGRFLDRVGLDQPALVLHSFRHGFRDACRAKSIPEETSRALGGWASTNEAARYGDRGMVPVLNRAVKKLSYGDFRLRDFASNVLSPDSCEAVDNDVGRPRRKRL